MFDGLLRHRGLACGDEVGGGDLAEAQASCRGYFRRLHVQCIAVMDMATVTVTVMAMVTVICVATSVSVTVTEHSPRMCCQNPPLFVFWGSTRT